MAETNGTESHVTVQKRTHYSPPWADVSIIGIAGSSGSGKSTLSHAIVRKLNLPWVVILSMVCVQFYPANHHHIASPLTCDIRTLSTTPSLLSNLKRHLPTNLILIHQRWVSFRESKERLLTATTGHRL